MSAVLTICILLLCLVLLIYFLLHPSDHSGNKLIQGSVVVLLDRINSFWYKQASFSKAKVEMYDVMVGWVDCDDLNFIANTSSEYHNGRKADEDSYQQLLHFEPYSYLLEGSWIALDINITSPPKSKGKNPFLLLFSNYEEYNKLQNQNTNNKAHYDNSIELKYTTGVPNEIVFNVTHTSFNFFGIKTPNGTDFTYNFTVYRVSFNDSNVDYQCYLSSDQTSCKLGLNVTKCVSCTKLCFLGQCLANSEAPAPFYSLDVTFNRQSLNWITSTLIAFVVSLFMLLMAIGTYDVMRKKVCPAGEKHISHLFGRRQGFD